MHGILAMPNIYVEIWFKARSNEKASGEAGDKCQEHIATVHQSFENPYA